MRTEALTPVEAGVALLATHRLTRLVVRDHLTDEPRRWLQRHLPEKLAYLIGCPWCSSFWLGGAVAWGALRHRDRPAVRTALLALAASSVTGFLAVWLDPDEDLGTVAGDN